MSTLRIGCIADLHGDLPPIPACDLLVVAGDLGPPAPGYLNSWPAGDAWLIGEFADWLRSSPAPVVGCLGNHDRIGELRPALVESLPWTLLHDGGAEVAGLRCWGSPWTRGDGDWAFTGHEARLARAYAQIPAGLDLLVTHGPPAGILDTSADGRSLGSASLADRVEAVRPRLHVFGHIHARGGREESLPGGTRFVNAAAAGDGYRSVRGVQAVELEPLTEETATLNRRGL